MRATWAWLALVAGCGRVGFTLTTDGDAGTDGTDDGPIAPLTVTRVTLREAVAGGIELGVVTSGSTFDITPVIASGVTLVAEVAGEADHIDFLVNGAFADERVVPYYSNGDTNGIPKRDLKLRVGPNSVVFTAYDDQGTPGPTLQLDFTLALDVSTPMTITSVNLIDDATGSNVLATLTGNDAIPLANLSTPSGLIDARVYTMPEHIGSVLTTITGSLSHTYSDNWAFYSSWGDDAGWAPAVGTYQLAFTPYPLGEAIGSADMTRLYTLTITP